jgi:hypothetical protein
MKTLNQKERASERTLTHVEPQREICIAAKDFERQRGTTHRASPLRAVREEKQSWRSKDSLQTRQIIFGKKCGNQWPPMARSGNEWLRVASNGMQWRDQPPPNQFTDRTQKNMVYKIFAGATCPPRAANK